MVRTQQDARRSLAEFEPALNACVTAAWDDFHSIDPEIRAHQRAGARATIVNSLVIKHARRLLGGLPGVVCVDGRQVFTVRIREEWVVKFKKLGRGLQVSSTGTQQALAFEDQSPHELALIPDEATHLHVGYVLNHTGTDLASVHVACPNGTRGNHWAYELRGDVASGSAPVALPTATGPDIPAPRVKARTQVGERTGTRRALDAEEVQQTVKDHAAAI